MRNVLLLWVLVFATIASAQEQQTQSLDVNYFYGSILRHNKDISHLIKGHPTGFILSYNTQTYGFKRWEEAYNYPDYGVSLIYHNPDNEVLGTNVGIHGHYNFYFLKRALFFRVGTGISYASNPFDLDKNFKNNAYGSRLLNSTYFMLNYKKQNIFKGFGIQAGLSLIHYSNGNVIAPNSSTNSLIANIGVTYNLDAEKTPEYQINEYASYTEPIHLNLVFRTGFNESDFVGTGQLPFYILSAYADKRVGYKSSLQVGADFFYSKFLEAEIDYIAAAFPSRDVKGDEDFKRAGVFVGHKLQIGKIALVTQVGYYVYYPYDFEGRIYIRPGLEYFVYKNVFTSITLKTHGAKAEAIEFGLGIRL